MENALQRPAGNHSFREQRILASRATTRGGKGELVRLPEHATRQRRAVCRDVEVASPAGARRRIIAAHVALAAIAQRPYQSGTASAPAQAIAPEHNHRPRRAHHESARPRARTPIDAGAAVGRQLIPGYNPGSAADLETIMDNSPGGGWMGQSTSGAAHAPTAHRLPPHVVRRHKLPARVRCRRPMIHQGPAGDIQRRHLRDQGRALRVLDGAPPYEDRSHDSQQLMSAQRAPALGIGPATIKRVSRMLRARRSIGSWGLHFQPVRADVRALAFLLGRPLGFGMNFWQAFLALTAGSSHL